MGAPKAYHKLINALNGPASKHAGLYPCRALMEKTKETAALENVALVWLAAQHCALLLNLTVDGKISCTTIRV